MAGRQTAPCSRAAQRVLLVGAVLVLAPRSIEAAPPKAVDAEAQEAEAAELVQRTRPGYAVVRHREDYAWLRSYTGPREALDAIKYIPFDARGRAYLSLGGDLRTRYELFEAPGFGLDSARDDFLLLRAQVHGDLHLGRHVRSFVQVSALGVLGALDPSPLDLNAFTIQQGFVEFGGSGRRGRSLALRVGRQELVLGSGRLVAIRKGPNFRRSFDMVHVDALLGRVRVQGFGGLAIAPGPGAFDDRSELGDVLWGAYATTEVVDEPRVRLVLDTYYLGVRRTGRALQDGAGLELRHSFGARLAGQLAGLDYNFEGVGQLGTLGPSSVLAWTVASDTGYRLTAADGPYAARLGLRADLTSGDGVAGDGRVGTFDALYPNLKYFSETGLLVPSNHVDLHPVLTLDAGPVRLVLDHGWFWRHRRSDAVYGPPTQITIAADASTARFVGQQLTAELVIGFGRHLSLTGYYAHFFVGPVIRDAGGRDVDFFGTWIEYIF